MSWLVNFVEVHFRTMFDDLAWVVYGQNTTILLVFFGVALLSALIVWVTLHRIRKSNTNLAAGLHRNAGHSLRLSLIHI